MPRSTAQTGGSGGDALPASGVRESFDLQSGLARPGFHAPDRGKAWPPAPGVLATEARRCAREGRVEPGGQEIPAPLLFSHASLRRRLDGHSKRAVYPLEVDGAEIDAGAERGRLGAVGRRPGERPPGSALPAARSPAHRPPSGSARAFLSLPQPDGLCQAHGFSGRQILRPPRGGRRSRSSAPCGQSIGLRLEGQRAGCNDRPLPASKTPDADEARGPSFPEGPLASSAGEWSGSTQAVGEEVGSPAFGALVSVPDAGE